MPLYQKQLVSNIRQHQTLNPSALKHWRWASIHFPQASSPCSTMHSSLSFFVSGQAQQIFFFGLVSGAGACPAFSSETGAAVVADEVFPISIDGAPGNGGGARRELEVPDPRTLLCSSGEERRRTRQGSRGTKPARSGAVRSGPLICNRTVEDPLTGPSS